MTHDSAFSVSEIGALNPFSAEPLYMQLAQAMSALIRRQGHLAVGKVLPSEAQCVERFKVSRPTVRQAMSHLLAQGLIQRRQGRGTFVAPLRLEHDVSHGFDDDMDAARHCVSYSLLKWSKIRAPADVAAALGQESATPCFLLRRTRTIEGTVVGVEERYLPPVLGDRLRKDDLERQPLLGLLQAATGTVPSWLEIEVSSAGANRSLSQLLQVRHGTPVLMRKTTFFAGSGRPMLHGTVTFLAQHYKFRFKVDYSARSQ